MTKRKKRKIKVPAAAYGIQGGSNWYQMTPQQQNTQYMQSLANGTYQNPNQQFMQQIAPGNQAIKQFSDQAYYNNVSNQFKLDMANKDPMGAQNAITAIQNGPDQLSAASGMTGASNALGKAAGIASAAGDALSLATSIGGESTATTGAEATKQSLADVGKGIASGASIGSVAGPMGAVIGAGVGAVIGSIGKKGRAADMTSFTEYDEGTLGTGFIGAFSNKKLRRRREAIKQNAWKNKAAVQGTGQLQAEYNMEHGQMDDNTFAYGGSTSSLAYVDDGELISTPDGTISKVPEQGKPTDSNLINLPGGSKILSDKLKVPGTNKTFAKLAEEMMATRKSKFNDKYAENAAKLNEMNNKNIHDQLFDIQEMVKAKKGIKRKYKNAVIAAESGNVIPYVKQPEYSNRYQLRQDGTLNFTANPDEVVNVGDIVMYGDTPYTIDSRYTFGNSGHAQWLASPTFGRDGVIDIYMPPRQVEPTTITPTNYSNTTAVTPKKVTASKASTRFKLSPSDWIGQSDDLELALSEIQTTPGKAKPTTIKAKPITVASLKTKEETPAEKPDYLGNLSSIASGIAGLVPILSNLNTRPEYQNSIHNPYSNAIMTTMRNRRYDINPVIREIERNRATSNYNSDQMNTNTGANLAFRLQNASNTARAIADVRSQESNINNAYLADYAKTLNDLGQQWANEERRVQDANMANRATARNIHREGLSGLSQWFQNRELMRNQRERDNAMLELYRDFLGQGFQSNTMSNWNRYIRRGGNR